MAGPSSVSKPAGVFGHEGCARSVTHWYGHGKPPKDKCKDKGTDGCAESGVEL